MNVFTFDFFFYRIGDDNVPRARLCVCHLKSKRKEIANRKIKNDGKEKKTNVNISLIDVTFSLSIIFFFCRWLISHFSHSTKWNLVIITRPKIYFFPFAVHSMHKKSWRTTIKKLIHRTEWIDCSSMVHIWRTHNLQNLQMGLRMFVKLFVLSLRRNECDFCRFIMHFFTIFGASLLNNKERV